MSIQMKLQVITELLEKKKYKKALLLIKKINSKVIQQTYSSMLLEGACYFDTKNFFMAGQAYEKALLLAINETDKLTALNNLKAVALAESRIPDACTYLKNVLSIDGTVLNAQARMDLCKLSASIGDFETVENYASKLFSLSYYTVEIRFLLVSIYKLKKEATALKKQLYKLSSDILLLSEQQKIDCIMMLLELGDLKKAESVFDNLGAEYCYDNWYQQLAISVSQYRNNNFEKLVVNGKKINTIPNDMVTGTSPTVVNLIKQLIQLLERSGASFNENLRIIENDGNLSVAFYSTAIENELLMDIPVVCMPLSSDFDFKISEEFKLIALAKKDSTNIFAHPIMMKMVEIYNETDKLKTWREVSPLFALRNFPEVIERLCAAKSFNVKVAKYKQLFDKKRWNDLLISSFLGSREFHYSSKMLLNSGIKTSADVELGLVAVMDFLNHKTGAPSFVYSHENKSIANFGVGELGTNEVFVEYNVSDPLITYLIYGFVDTYAPWVYSTTLELNTYQGAVIYIQNNPTPNNHIINERNKHLRKFLPTNIQSNGKDIVVSSLTIPATSEHGTLRQILSFILTNYGEKGLYQNDKLLCEEVRSLEKQLIEKNKLFWHNLREEVVTKDENSDKFPQTPLFDITLLCNVNLNFIADYENYQNISNF